MASETESMRSAPRHRPAGAVRPGGGAADSEEDANAGWRGIAGFLAFSHGWTWAFWAAAAAASPTVWEWPGAFFFYLGGIGVPLGALAMTWRGGGADGLRGLGRRLVDPRGLGVRWWAAVLGLFPAAALASAALARLAGATATPIDLDRAARSAGSPAALLATLGFILLMGPLPEEIGWRGYLLDRLQRRWSVLAATLAVAAAWWAWHLPLYALPGYFDAFGGAPRGPAAHLAALVPTAVLYTWIYNGTGRSLLAVVAFHFAENVTGEMMGIAVEVRPYRIAVLAACALLVVRHLDRERRRS